MSRSAPSTTTHKNEDEKMGLSTLPYDLLLNIASYLELRDIHALHLTCKSLQDFSVTRPMYRNLANDLLRRCRALPLKDLTTPQFIRSVDKATRYESARPIKGGSYSSTGIKAHSNHMDTLPATINHEKWYKIVSAPPGEDVDWLSPITSLRDEQRESRLLGHWV